MDRKYFFIPVLILILVVSGCIGQDKEEAEFERNNNGVKTKFDYRSHLRPGEIGWLNFEIVSVLPNDMGDVQIRVDPGPFELINLDCGRGGSKDGETVCKFDEIVPDDMKGINVGLRAPSEEVVGELELDFNVLLGVYYDYTGNSEIRFPILSSPEEKTESMIQPVPAIGPIQAMIEPSFFYEVTTETGEKEMRDWIVEDSFFTYYFNFDNVANLGIGFEYPAIEIDKDDFRLYLNNVELSEQENAYCDFEKVGTSDDGETILKSKVDVTVPSVQRLSCDLVADDIGDVPWTSGSIRSEFSYNYRFVKVFPITVSKYVE